MQQNLRVLVWWCVALVLLGGCVAGELVGDNESSATEEDFLPQSRRDAHRHRPRAAADAGALTAPDAQANAVDAGALRDPDAGASAADAAASRPDARVAPDLGPVDEYGAGGCLQATGNPLGGGAGYTLGISRSDPRVKYIVDTASELLAALQSARSGEVIYIEGTANIDLSGRFSVGVPAGVTLASNRGENGAAGGRIFQTGSSGSEWASPLLIKGENVRISGLRLQGPDNSTSSPLRVGIKSWYKRLEVDNCEIWGWGAAAINVYTTGGSDMKAGGYFHHNSIHHCQRSGLGYGIVVSEGAVCLVEANIFDYNRHAIAGSAHAGNGYEARFNLIGEHFIAGTAHNFDMHTGPNNIAGDLMRIHHNTFTCKQPADAFPIFIQGVPRVGAYIDHNWFYYTQYAPVWQSHGRGNLFVTDNLIGPDRVLHPSGPIKYL